MLFQQGNAVRVAVVGEKKLVDDQGAVFKQKDLFDGVFTGVFHRGTIFFNYAFVTHDPLFAFAGFITSGKVSLHFRRDLPAAGFYKQGGGLCHCRSPLLQHIVKFCLPGSLMVVHTFPVGKNRKVFTH